MTERTMNATGFGQDMNDPYFQWLCKRIDIRPGRQPYLRLATELHSLIFRPGKAIESDDNRANDGLQLRVEFIERYGVSGSSGNRGPCTMLEFLIGLSIRMSFLMEEGGNGLNTAHYFMEMIRNLRLDKLTDDRYEDLNGDFFVGEAVDRVLFRNYEWDGRGGLFPLKHCTHDQRKVEIWYQMNSWLLESNEFIIE